MQNGMIEHVIEVFSVNMTTATSTNWTRAPNATRWGTKEDRDILTSMNRQKAELLIPAILYTVLLMIIGAVGNPIAIYIYGWKWRRTTTRVFLFWLAVIDLVNCLVTMPTEIYIMTNFYYFPSAGFCRMSRFTTYVINNASAAVFIAIAIDRYIRICHPYRKSFSVFGAQLACALSSCIGVCVSWPALVLYGSKKIPLPSSRMGKSFIFGVICDVKNEMDRTPYPLAFFIYLWCGFSVCFLILSALYVLIGRVMLTRRKRKKLKAAAESTHLSTYLNHNAETTLDGPTYELSATNEEPNSGDTKCATAIQVATSSWKNSRIRPPRSTLMLFAITAVFVMSFLPFLIIMTVRQHVGPLFYPSLSPWEQVTVNLFSRSYLVNNCANPIVYGLCNTQFRDQVKKLFHISSKRREPSLSREESRLSKGLSC